MVHAIIELVETGVVSYPSTVATVKNLNDFVTSDKCFRASTFTVMLADTDPSVIVPALDYSSLAPSGRGIFTLVFDKSQHLKDTLQMIGQKTEQEYCANKRDQEKNNSFVMTQNLESLAFNMNKYGFSAKRIFLQFPKGIKCTNDEFQLACFEDP